MEASSGALYETADLPAIDLKRHAGDEARALACEECHGSSEFLGTPDAPHWHA
jgi:hypothetical protein